MRGILQRFELDEEISDFDNYSHQFATVSFDRGEDDKDVTITVIHEGKVTQWMGDNTYNTSLRRQSSAVYLKEESEDGEVAKLCTIQHKGITYLELHKVSASEYSYLFEGAKLKS